MKRTIFIAHSSESAAATLGRSLQADGLCEHWRWFKQPAAILVSLSTPGDDRAAAIIVDWRRELETIDAVSQMRRGRWKLPIIFVHNGEDGATAAQMFKSGASAYVQRAHLVRHLGWVLVAMGLKRRHVPMVRE